MTPCVPNLTVSCLLCFMQSLSYRPLLISCSVTLVQLLTLGPCRSYEHPPGHEEGLGCGSQSEQVHRRETGDWFRCHFSPVGKNWLRAWSVRSFWYTMVAWHQKAWSSPWARQGKWVLPVRQSMLKVIPSLIWECKFENMKTRMARERNKGAGCLGLG